MVMKAAGVSLLSLAWLWPLLSLQKCLCEDNVPVVCGGFVKSDFQADFAKVKVFTVVITNTCE